MPRFPTGFTWAGEVPESGSGTQGTLARDARDIRDARDMKTSVTMIWVDGQLAAKVATASLPSLTGYRLPVIGDRLSVVGGRW